MFTKTRGDEPQPTSQSTPQPNTPPEAKRKPNRAANAHPASIGPSVSISGNLSGNEDLVIEGSVEGEIVVKDHMVTISQTGRVKADVYGRAICVEGEVTGNLVGDEQVIIRQSGRVQGNVTAPKVNLENGAQFKGSIDMQPVASAPAKAEVAKRPDPAPEKNPGRSAGAAQRTPRVAGETA